jgi:hypothetical protein
LVISHKKVKLGLVFKGSTVDADLVAELCYFQIGDISLTKNNHEALYMFVFFVLQSLDEE